MKIIFFGTSFYCQPILEVIHKNFELVGIVTKKESLIEKYALKYNQAQNQVNVLLNFKEKIVEVANPQETKSEQAVETPTEKMA